MLTEPVVVSGMALHTPLSDELTGNLAALMAGRSAITHWRSIDTSRIYAKIGGDLGDVDLSPALAALTARLPPGMGARLQRLARRLPHMPLLGLVTVARAVLDAGLEEAEAAEAHVLIAGANLSDRLMDEGFARYGATRGGIEASHELYLLDSTLAACVSELLGSRGPAFVINGACASGNLALLAGLRELRHHGAKRVIVLGAPSDVSPRVAPYRAKPSSIRRSERFAPAISTWASAASASSSPASSTARATVKRPRSGMCGRRRARRCSRALIPGGRRALSSARAGLRSTSPRSPPILA